MNRSPVYFSIASFLICCMFGMTNGAPPATCPGSYAADTDDCTKFYMCVHDQAIPLACPSGLNWNQKTSGCDWPANTECASSNSPNAPSQPSQPGTPSNPTPMSEPNEPPQQPQQPQPIPNQPSQSNGKCGPNKKSVCYFTNWSGYRTGDGKYEAEDIDPKLCTNVIYAFAIIDPATGKIKSHDEWADKGKKLFEKVTALKKQGVKVSIAVGGWTDSTSQNYGPMLTDPQKRHTFVESAKQFVKDNNFDGLDLDLEYPGCWQNNCDPAKAPAEKAGFAALTKELSDSFKPEGLLLSAAVSANPSTDDQAYDIPEISKNLDWINLMSYDYHGQWDGKTGANAPFGGSDNLNVKASVDYWLQKGAAPEKLVVGMPTYGQSFTLANAQNNGFNAPTTGPGTAGEFSKAAGTLAYYEICEKAKKEGWKSVHDKENDSYATKDNQWVSYDDVDDFRKKGKYICEKGLGGGMIWTLDFDDFKGKCGCGKYPLLTAMNQEIRGVGGAQVQNCT